MNQPRIQGLPVGDMTRGSSSEELPDALSFTTFQSELLKRALELLGLLESKPMSSIIEIAVLGFSKA